MANTIDIRRRIRSVKNMKQITKAMKMVSAAKLRRAQDRMFSARPYAGALQKVLSSVASRVEDIAAHPLLQARPENNVLLIVVTSDKGLAGAFNSNVIRATQRTMREQKWQSVELLVIGRKANDFFKRRPVTMRREGIQLLQAMMPGTSREIAEGVVSDFVTERVDAVYAVYNEFKSIMAQNVRVERLLPIERNWEERGQEVDYLYEPGPDVILTELLPKHIEFQLYRILLESAAAEQGARMTAMESATKNAGDIIDHLTLTYNRIRQASITKEIIEIVSGAAAAGG